MTDTIVPAAPGSAERGEDSLLDRLARSLMLRQLNRLSVGLLKIEEGDRVWQFGTPCDVLPRSVVVRIDHPAAWSDLAFGGSAGAGEAFIKGLWHCEQLTDLVRLFLRNRAVLDAVDGGVSLLVRPLHRLAHWLQRNTREGSRRNIQAHYDIGNDLFRLFLDPQLMYSSAYYTTPETDLDTAAVAKLDRVCRKLDLQAGHHLLEIGTGWGGLAIHAAKHYGCRVTTTTISREQFDLATERVAAAGLTDLIDVRFDDYRELGGSYDRIVSIEMIEAVGHQFMETYFAQCSRLLKPEGQMLIQAITVDDRYYKQALQEVDFIKRFVFPGGFLPSVTAMSNALTRASDMRIAHLEDIGLHYARTLRDWRARFMARLQEVKALGYPDEFIRMWEFYLCYSEGGLAERHLGTVQMLLSKPDARPIDVAF
ncbi:MAG: class I SAM-dependent methyltransferase [Gammaproteobacteria bacterium]|nr:class I SAM-dependent methyltransferase [Gammaproteobacteria bacterium]